MDEGLILAALTNSGGGGGGGSGVEKFTVTFDVSGEEVTADKTVAQILAAQTAGKLIVGKLGDINLNYLGRGDGEEINVIFEIISKGLSDTSPIFFTLVGTADGWTMESGDLESTTIVTFTGNTYSPTCDTEISDIYDAADDGKVVFAKYNNGLYLRLTEYSSNSGNRRVVFNSVMDNIKITFEGNEVSGADVFVGTTERISEVFYIKATMASDFSSITLISGMTMSAINTAYSAGKLLVFQLSVTHSSTYSEKYYVPCTVCNISGSNRFCGTHSYIDDENGNYYLFCIKAELKSDGTFETPIVKRVQLSDIPSS